MTTTMQAKPSHTKASRAEIDHVVRELISSARIQLGALCRLHRRQPLAMVESRSQRCCEVLAL